MKYKKNYLGSRKVSMWSDEQEDRQSKEYSVLENIFVFGLLAPGLLSALICYVFLSLKIRSKPLQLRMSLWIGSKYIV
jgi:hypothetical protein